MPAGKKISTNSAEQKSGNSSQNVKGYKPPWIKEAAEPNKETETPWGIMRKRDNVVDPDEVKQQRRVSRKMDDDDDDDDDSASGFAIPQLRKVSVTKVEKAPENGERERDVQFARPPLKSVKAKERSPKPITKEDSKIIIPKLNSVKVEKMKELPPPPKKDNPDYRGHLKKAPTKDKIDEERKKGVPMPPPMPPPAPALPKIKTDPLSDVQKARLENLKSRPKTRPDWTALLKGIECGAKLKHVETNDRSKPLLPAVKAKGQFLYESEKDNAHNVLLNEIKQGINLKSVKTNDRSRPILEGLRKFRRQMTVEEQIQKSMSMASIPPEEIHTEEADEMDDIDKVRDDLQSTKQLLAIEMRNKEAAIRENKRLQSKVNNLETALEIEEGVAQAERDEDKKREPDEKLIVTLKAEAAEARRRSEDLEKKYTQSVTELEKAKFEIEEMKRKNSELEKKLQEVLCEKKFSISDRRDSQLPGEEDDFTPSDDESEEEETEEKRQKRLTREVKMLHNKLRNFQNKVDNAKKERIALKELVKKHQGAIKEERKKYRQLQKEVDKMAALMKESESDEDDEEASDADAETTETESSESDSESSETESESERSHSEPEDAPPEKKKENLIGRSLRQENRLSALKKTNFMLKTNAERLQDELNQQKVLTHTLQEDLDSVLAELG